MSFPFILEGEVIKNKKLKGFEEDACRLLGGDNTAFRFTIQDTLFSDKHHRDGIQLIPTGTEPNAQFFGAVAYNNTINFSTITSEGLLQCIFQSDGAQENLTITNNVLTTKGAHYITVCGMLSGKILNNTTESGEACPVLLDNLRIGGGHERSFYVLSFRGSQRYQAIENNCHASLSDYRGQTWRRGANYVEDFDLDLFRQLSMTIPYDDFEQHFTDTLDAYEEEEKRMTQYSSDTMTVTAETISIPNRLELTEADHKYWDSRWKKFQPYELSSRDFSVHLDTKTRDNLESMRLEYGKPLSINSAWRTPSHNKSVGGRSNSDHTEVAGREINGSGYDVHISSRVMGKELEKLAIKHGFNVIGRYRSGNFIHISRRKPKPSGKIYQWGYF